MSDAPQSSSSDPTTGLSGQRQMPLLRQGFHRGFHLKTFAEIQQVMRQAMDSIPFPGSPRKPSSSTTDSH